MMMKPKFSLSSVLWATALVAILVAWWLDRHRLVKELWAQDEQIKFLESWRAKAMPELIRLPAMINDLKVKLIEVEFPPGPVSDLDDAAVPDDPKEPPVESELDPFADPKNADDEPPTEDFPPRTEDDSMETPVEPRTEC